MSLRVVHLPGPVAVIPSMKVLERLGRDLPDPVALGHEMTSLSQRYGLPARLDLGNGDPALMVYTDRCVAWLRPTGKLRDAYRITRVAPRRLMDHGRLASGALMLRSAAGWRVLGDVRQLSQPGVRFDTYWPLIAREWALVAAPDAAGSTVRPHHTQYLDLLTRVIEAGHDIETAKLAAAEPMRYRGRASAREQRFNARGVYDFTMARPTRPTIGTVVYVDQRPQMRGRVVEISGLVVTVRFETAVDFAEIPPQGALRELPSDRVFNAQLAAVGLARTGRAANGWLLTGLVDRHLQPFQPDTSAVPKEPLDPQQLRAFHRALTVPDLSLVLGPPGTGKTRTITEIALNCAERGERVLITSHTHRAVDNVLERIPATVRSVRVGNEDKVTGDARGYLADVQVEAVQRDVAARTEAAANRLATFGRNPDLDRWLSYLDEQLAAATAKQSHVDMHGAARDAAAERATASVRPRIQAAEMALLKHDTRLAAATRAVASRRSREHWVQTRGAGLGWLSRPLRWWAARAEHAVTAALSARHPVAAELAQARAQAQKTIANDPGSRWYEAERATAQRLLDDVLSRVEQAAGALRSMVAPLVLPPPLPARLELAEHQRFAAWLRATVVTLRQRAALIAEWRDSIPQAGRELERELVRYASVVAATCIGTATAEALADLKFDTVIVDEAGQISLPNLLVPLVRARRAVLVGDHRQLPPFLDDDVKRWSTDLARSGDEPAPVVAEIADLLRMSAFERLYRPGDDGHQDMLITQRRMPPEIGNFVSHAFYNGMLRTDHPGAGVDPVFGRPFVMVDTADRTADERRESDGRRREDWNQHGYVNELEATLIAELMTVYAGWYTDWAVILPYRAQVELVRQRVASALGDGGHSAERVGTVDSFQGGERDLIVYGFTRSNATGDIGFLRELRRLNVAISRAKQQLVLVGDVETLSRATVRSFAELIRSMVAYLGQGGVRGSLEVQAMLTDRGMVPR